MTSDDTVTGSKGCMRLNRSHAWGKELSYGQQDLGLTCEVDFVCAHMDENTEEVLLLYDVPSSGRAAHALQMLYLI